MDSDMRKSTHGLAADREWYPQQELAALGHGPEAMRFKSDVDSSEIAGEVLTLLGGKTTAAWSRGAVQGGRRGQANPWNWDF